MTQLVRMQLIDALFKNTGGPDAVAKLRDEINVLALWFLRAGGTCACGHLSRKLFSRHCGAAAG